MQSLKVPEAVIAFAQAAAKTNDLHGWPLWPPMQMQKCDKCSQEFCSPVNYRRHIRVHRRSLKIDKDFAKNRAFLGAFWDKLSLEEAKEIVSVKDDTLEDVRGSSIINALASSPLYRKLSFSSLPHVYTKAGCALLDVVQARYPRFPMPSEDFFSILDDASEKTFLCAGAAPSVQKFVFDGDAGNICLETKNLAACTSFLVEQKLVKAWIADKDAEALRCQKMLVAEEEAAQRRQAELMERKRLKKLRQKEHRAKDQIERDKADKHERPCIADLGPSAEVSNQPFESVMDTVEISSSLVQVGPMPAEFLDATDDKIGVVCNKNPGGVNMNYDNGRADAMNSQNLDAQAPVLHTQKQRKENASRRPSLKWTKNTPNGFHPVQINMLKSPAAQRLSYKDQRSSSSSSNHKVWTRKTKHGVEVKAEVSNIKRLMETGDQPDQSNCSEVLIGSISIMLGDHGVPQKNGFPVASLDRCDNTDDENLVLRSFPSQHLKPDGNPIGMEHSPVKMRRLVAQQKCDGLTVALNDEIKDRVDGNAVGCSSESCETTCSSGNNGSDACEDHLIADGASSDQRHFSSCFLTARAFLKQRWEGALASGLVLSARPETPDPYDDGESSEACIHYSASGKTENKFSGTGTTTVIAASSSSKFGRAAAEKGSGLVSPSKG